MWREDLVEIMMWWEVSIRRFGVRRVRSGRIFQDMSRYVGISVILRAGKQYLVGAKNCCWNYGVL